MSGQYGPEDYVDENGSLPEGWDGDVEADEEADAAYLDKYDPNNSSDPHGYDDDGNPIYSDDGEG